MAIGGDVHAGLFGGRWGRDAFAGLVRFLTFAAREQGGCGEEEGEGEDSALIHGSITLAKDRHGPVFHRTTLHNIIGIILLSLPWL